MNTRVQHLPEAWPFEYISPGKVCSPQDLDFETCNGADDPSRISGTVG